MRFRLVLLAAPLSLTIACAVDDGAGDSADAETGEVDAGDGVDTGEETGEETGDETGGLLEPVCDSELAGRVEADAVAAHLAALHELAQGAGGNRAAGTPGYEASAVYVEEQLAELGYLVERWAFEFDRFVINTPELLELPPEGFADVALGVDFQLATWSPSGQLTAPVEAVDLELGLGNGSTSGCEADDFASFTPGSVALIQRGSCTFSTKAQYAEEAGAVAVLIFNQGDSEDRLGLFGGTLGSGNELGAPVMLTSYAVGEALAEAAALDTTEISITADTGVVTTETFNILAETPGGDPDSVVMLGAHLDSVPAGPGVNDNGSGTSTVLELARQFADCQPRNKVRFAWWGAEEWGLIGSRRWVEALPDEELASLALYLNFDMVASPNYVRYVHSGAGGPEGSELLYTAFSEWFEDQGLAISPAGFSGRSDYQPFVEAGVPAGGLATGAGGSKTEAQAETYGGMAGSAFDGCYHQLCDDDDNYDLEVLGQNAQAAAHVLERYAGDLGGLAGEASVVTVEQEIAAPAIHECGKVHE